MEKMLAPAIAAAGSLDANVAAPDSSRHQRVGNGTGLPAPGDAVPGGVEPRLTRSQS
jgi:hypothetical protein